MSQPPQPSPPQFPYGPVPYAAPSVPTNYQYYAPADHPSLTGARRAAIMLFIVGGLITLLGFCNFVTGAMRSADGLRNDFAKLPAESSAAPFPVSMETLRTLTIVIAGATFLIGLAFIGLGAGVRRGSRTAAIAALAMSGLILIANVLFTLVSAFAAFAVPLYLVCACASIVPAGLLATIIVMLIGTLRAHVRLRAAWTQQIAMHQQGMLYWQYQQQAQPQATAAPTDQPPSAGGPTRAG